MEEWRTLDEQIVDDTERAEVNFTRMHHHEEVIVKAAKRIVAEGVTPATTKMLSHDGDQWLFYFKDSVATEARLADLHRRKGWRDRPGEKGEKSYA